MGARDRMGAGSRVWRVLASSAAYLGGVARDVVAGWHRHRCNQQGAAIAFYAMFSFVPLLLLLTSGLGFALALWEGAALFKESLARLIAEATSPVVADLAIDAISATQDARGQLGIVGLAALLLAATGAFVQLETSVQVVWDLYVSPDPVPFRIQAMNFLRTRLASFLLVAGVGLVIFLSLVGEVLLDAITRQTAVTSNAVVRLIDHGGGLALAGIIVTVLFRWLPRRRVPWRAALAGGWLTACLWEVAKQLLSAYLTRRDYANAYPILGSALALLVWVYVASLVFLLGAEVAASITSREAARRNARIAARL